jgi:hypothetical protein
MFALSVAPGHFRNEWASFEIWIFVALGGILGLISAFFIRMNLVVTKRRKKMRETHGGMWFLSVRKQRSFLRKCPNFLQRILREDGKSESDVIKEEEKERERVERELREEKERRLIEEREEEERRRREEREDELRGNASGFGSDTRFNVGSGGGNSGGGNNGRNSGGAGGSSSSSGNIPSGRLSSYQEWKRNSQMGLTQNTSSASSAASSSSSSPVRPPPPPIDASHSINANYNSNVNHSNSSSPYPTSSQQSSPASSGRPSPRMNEASIWVLEGLFVALVTGLTNYPFTRLLKMNSVEAIHALFETCPHEKAVSFGLCKSPGGGSAFNVRVMDI